MDRYNEWPNISFFVILTSTVNNFSTPRTVTVVCNISFLIYKFTLNDAHGEDVRGETLGN